MSYIGNSPGVASQRVTTTFVATDVQTVFTPTSGYTVGYLDVFVNGTKLINGTDYTATNGITVTLIDPCVLSDDVETVAYIPRGLSDGYLKSEANALFLGASNNAVTATTATNLAGGSVGTIPYQSANGTTTMLSAGTAGQVLKSNGSSAPLWAASVTYLPVLMYGGTTSSVTINNGYIPLLLVSGSTTNIPVY